MNRSRLIVPHPELSDVSPEMAEQLEALLLYLKESRGFDFTASPMRVKVTCTRLANPNGGDPQGVILLMEETDGRTNDPSHGEGER